jgi:probable HAF family extracellular repeat protein
MKGKTLFRTGALVALILVTSIGTVFGQTNMTGNEMLAMILSETNTIPLDLYPPGHLEWLAAIGDDLLPPVEFGPSRPVRDVPLDPLVSLESGGGGGRFSRNGPSPNDSAPEYEYALVDLGTVGGNYSWAYGINNNGKIVGYSTISGDGAYSAFSYLNGNIQNLGTLGGASSYCFGGLNAIGQVVGSSFTSGGGPYHAFLYSGSTMTDIGTLGLNGSSSVSGANAINAGGTIVGGSDDHAFKYSGGTMTDLGTFLTGPSLTATAQAINDYGDIASNASTNGITRMFLTKDGTTTDLGSLGGKGGTVYAINMYGEVVGQANTTGDTSSHAIFFDTSMQDLGVLSGDTSSAAYGLNNSAHVVGTSASGSSTRAFIVSNGSMRDLNASTINATGWTLQAAWAINDKEQIVGWGADPSGHVHGFLLNPLPYGWRDHVVTTPAQISYGNYPSKQSGKDSLVLITHGWQPYPLPKDVGFVDSMSNAVQGYLTSHSLNNWQVNGFKWLDNSWTIEAASALLNAQGEGTQLGKALAQQGWSHVHLISFSAGANLIQETSKFLKIAGATVHCTFLDPYVGDDKAGVADYGSGDDWSDQYFSRDVTGDVTEQPLVNAYNVDVTQLGAKTGITKFRSQNGTMDTCTRTIRLHGSPIDFYMNTITGNNVDSDYAGFGFPLSKEGGGWNSGIPNYTRGNGTPGHTELIRRLGTADPSCVNDINITPPTWPNFIPNFTVLTTVSSTTGSNQKWDGAVDVTPGSPSWVATVIIATNAINTLSFDAQFSGVTNSEDMLTISWDADTIGTVDERVAPSGFRHYSLKFNTAAAYTPHMLSFRVDPYTSAKSTASITNVVLTQIGPSVPFTLSPTANRTNGAIVWRLDGEAGFAYGIQASTNLTTTNWIDVAELINTNGAVQFYDQDSTNYPMRFYRAYVPMAR